MLQKLIDIHNTVVSLKKRKKVRYLYDRTNWNDNVICIYGARGTGKTTLMIQDYYKRFGTAEKALYITADHISIISNGLYEVADRYFKYGGKALYIDEIHKYPNWSLELKNIIDVYSDRQIIFSGSSSLMLHKGKGDLSRRVVYHKLKGLSFREFIYFSEDINLNPITFKQILNSHLSIAEKYNKKISSRKTPVLKLFREYIDHGYYPFFMEGINSYHNKLSNIIEKIIFEDIAVIYNLHQINLPAIKKILWLIGTSQPFVPNIERISRNIGISRESVYNYLEYLEKSGIIISVRKPDRGLRLVRKPSKIFMENCGLIINISEETGSEALWGSLRETFFVNQISDEENFNISETGDFLVNGKYLIELGGKNKGFKQIKGEENGYIASDDIEIGFGGKIPLYLFGFLY